MNKGFQEKLDQYAPPVPERAWEAIEARLNEEASFVSRLQSYETPPPPAVWSRLVSNLPQTGRVKPMWKKVLPYALAASLLAFVVLAGNVILNSSSSNSIVSSPQNPSIKEGPTVNNAASDLETLSAVGSEEDQVYTSNQPRTASTFKSAVRFENMGGMAYASGTEVPDFIPEKAESKPSITSEYADKYMVHTDESGNAVRVPKKIFELVDCVKADPVCKDRIESLQQKIALSSVTTEFTGLLDLIKNLKENQ